jgi:hypothetical protein
LRENAFHMAADDDSEDVLSRLPKTRPARRSTRRASAQAGAEAPAKPAAKRAARPKATTAKPKPKAAPKPKAPPPPPASEAPRKPIEPPTGGEILEAAVQAAKDIAQVGLVVGHEALKAVRSRLPGGR